MPEARHPINPTLSDRRERSVGFPVDPSCVSKTRYRRNAVVCLRHTALATQATPHCVYRLSVGLIGRCAFSTCQFLKAYNHGDVQTPVLLMSVPEARHPINPTLSDRRERSVGFPVDPSCVSKTRYRRNAVVCLRHTALATQATPHCVYRLSVGLIGRCAFSTCWFLQAYDYGDIKTPVSPRGLNRQTHFGT